MSDIKKQIFTELDALEAGIMKLQGSETASKNQTDLEIAILREQVAKQKESQKTAADKIDKALSIIKAIK